MISVRACAPGLLVVAVVAAAATVLGRALPFIGTPVIALLAGAAIAAIWARAVSDSGPLGPGLGVARQRLLQVAVVLLGLGLPFDAVLNVGRRTALVLIGTLVIGVGAAFAVGRMLALDRESATLVGVGTTICGASAIAAATAVIHPRRETAAYALGTIFVFNVLAVLVFPPAGRLLGLSDEAFGLWAGTAINDTSSVLAAGVVFGPAAAQFALVVKLARSLMIVPMCLGLHWERRRHAPTGEKLQARRILPVFVLLFLAASVIAGTGVIPPAANAPLAHVSTWLIAAALTAIGTALSWQRVRQSGSRPLLFGGILGAALAIGSLALQTATGWR
ncbi:YeiH family protein [Nocardia sp. IFM 10818]